MLQIKELDDIQFDYTNWKGDKARRDVKVWGFYYGSTDYHPEEQLLVEAWDFDKQAVRMFSLKDMSNIEVVSESE